MCTWGAAVRALVWIDVQAMDTRAEVPCPHSCPGVAHLAFAWLPRPLRVERPYRAQVWLGRLQAPLPRGGPPQPVMQLPQGLLPHQRALQGAAAGACGGAGARVRVGPAWRRPRQCEWSKPRMRPAALGSTVPSRPARRCGWACTKRQQQGLGWESFLNFAGITRLAGHVGTQIPVAR